MKVAFVLLDGELTGGQVVALELMQGLLERGDEALAVVPREGPILARLGQNGIETAVLPLSRSYRLDQAVALARALRRRSVDLVDTHTLYVGNQLTAVAARLARIPIVVHSHIDERYHGSRAVRVAQRLARRATGEPAATVAVSDHLREHLVESRSVDPHRVVVIHNGIRLGERTPPPVDEPLRLLCVARLAPVKGQEILLDALRRCGPEVAVDFAGVDLEHGGAYGRRLEVLAGELGVADRVRFLGRRDDIPHLLRASAGLVLPSLAEGFPLVVLEAMAEARAVIATAVGGTAEAVADGETGLLVPPADPEALAAALSRLAGEPGLRRRLGEAGYARVARDFTRERMVETTISLYRDTCAGSARSATSPGPAEP